MSKTGSLVRLVDTLGKSASEYRALATTVKKRAALEIIKELIKRTPVDTSQALSNWIISINRKNPAFLPAWWEGEHGSTKAASANTTLLAAKAILGGVKDKDKISIQNNAPWITYLNEGSSSQAPAGFIEASVLVGMRKAKVSKRG